MKKREIVLSTVIMMALIGCTEKFDEDTKIRNAYNSQEDCVKENNPSDCQYSSHYGSHGYWFGRSYPYGMYSSTRNSRSVGIAANEGRTIYSHSSISSNGGIKSTISRGGFGSSAHGVSTGG